MLPDQGKTDLFNHFFFITVFRSVEDISSTPRQLFGRHVERGDCCTTLATDVLLLMFHMFYFVHTALLDYRVLLLLVLYMLPTADGSSS